MRGGKLSGRPWRMSNEALGAHPPDAPWSQEASMRKGSIHGHSSLWLFPFFGGVVVDLVAPQCHVCAAQRSESAVCIHIPLLFDLPHPTPHAIPLGQNRTPSWALCYTTGSHHPPILHMAMHIRQSQSPSSLPLHPHIGSLYPSLYSCPTNRFICTIFLDSTYRR